MTIAMRVDHASRNDMPHIRAQRISELTTGTRLLGT